MKDTFQIFQRDENQVVFPEGQVVFNEGDPGQQMYVVTAGEAEIRIGGRVLETLGAGEIFGEMALVDPGQPRAATVAAKTELKCAVIDERRFQFLVEQTPRFALQVMRVLVGRLRRMDEYVSRGQLA